MKIFLSISSYKDPLLVNTLQSAYENAHHKENIVFAVVDQSDSKLDLEEFSFIEQIRYLHLDAKYARGCAWARSLAQSLFMGEDYFFQVDSHTIFEDGWDEYFIKYYRDISKKFYRPVISNYPRNFEVIDLEKQSYNKYQQDDKSTHVMVIDKENVFKDGYFSMQKGLPSQSKEIYRGFLISAGFMFAESRLIEDVPYDPHLYFEGEETTLSLRLFTNGYDVFHIPKIPLFHCYVDYSNLAKRPMHWNEDEDKNRTVKWTELQAKSKKRIDRIVQGNLTNVYGLGSVRSLADYKDFTGIDIKNKKIVDEERAFTFKKLYEYNWKESPKKNFLW